MNRAALILALLTMLAVGWIGATIEFSTTATVSDGWRRTADGWQHRDDWTPSFDYPALPHPLVVASLQVLVCTGGLIALSRPAGKT